MERTLAFLSENPALVWTGASLALGGLVLYWSHHTGNNSPSSPSPGANTLSLEELFFKGSLTEALKLHGSEGAPLVLAIEDATQASEVLRAQIWMDERVQGFLSRPVIAVRMAHDSKDGRFAQQLIAQSPPEVRQLPLLLVFRHGQTRVLSLRSMLDTGGYRKARAVGAVRTLLSRVAREAALSAAGEARGADSATQKQRDQAERLRLMRGDWEVVQLVRGGQLNLRDIIPDAAASPAGAAPAAPSAGAAAATAAARPSLSPATAAAGTSALRTAAATEVAAEITSQTRENSGSWHQSYAPSAERGGAQSSSAAVKRQQDWAYQTSLEKDRKRADERLAQEERQEVEAEAAELEAAVALSNELSKQADLDRTRSLIPPEPPSDGAGASCSFVFRLPDGSRLSRRFDAAGALEGVFHYLDVELGEREPPITNYSFTAYPHRSFSKASELQASLESAGLTGRVAVFVRDLES